MLQVKHIGVVSALLQKELVLRLIVLLNDQAAFFQQLAALL